MNAAIVVAIAAASGSIAAAYFSYKASTRATAVEATKVEQDAFDRSVRFYEQQLDRMTSQLDRMNVQMERVTTQLAQEQDVSNALRNHVRTLQIQVDALTQTIAELRARMAARHGQAAP